MSACLEWLLLYFRSSLSLIFLDVCPPLFVKISFSGIETEQEICGISFSVFCLTPFLCSLKRNPCSFPFCFERFLSPIHHISLVLILVNPVLFTLLRLFFFSLNIHITKHSFVNDFSLTSAFPYIFLFLICMLSPHLYIFPSSCLQFIQENGAI